MACVDHWLRPHVVGQKAGPNCAAIGKPNHYYYAAPVLKISAVAHMPPRDGVFLLGGGVCSHARGDRARNAIPNGKRHTGHCR